MAVSPGGPLAAASGCRQGPGTPRYEAHRDSSPGEAHRAGRDSASGEAHRLADALVGETGAPAHQGQAASGANSRPPSPVKTISASTPRSRTKPAIAAVYSGR